MNDVAEQRCVVRPIRYDSVRRMAQPRVMLTGPMHTDTSLEPFWVAPFASAEAACRNMLLVSLRRGTSRAGCRIA